MASDGDVVAEVGAAVCDDLRLLAAMHDAELDAPAVARLKAAVPGALALALESPAAREGTALIAGALARLPEPPEQASLDELAADYAAIYLTRRHHASPEESVWLDEDGLTRQEPMFQVRRWYAHYGLAVPDWRTRADDHLVHQLQFLATVMGTGDVVAFADAARFLDDHLLRWLTTFATRVASRCATPFYAGAALLTAAYCEELRDLLAEVLDQPRPSADEIEARMRPPQARAQRRAAGAPGTRPAS